MFCLLTGFAFGEVVFPEYMDKDIPPFVRRVFPEKVENMEKKMASLGKAAKVKAAQPSDDMRNVKIQDLENLIKDHAMWERLSDEDSVRVCLLYMSEVIFMGQELEKVVKPCMLRLVEDIPAWNAFPWGEYYWEQFYENVKNLIHRRAKVHMKILEKNTSSKPTYSIYGFAWALKASIC